MDVEIANPAPRKSALDLLSKRVSLVASLIAILAAFSGIFASRCTTRGQVYKNNAIEIQSAVANEWAFYQSRNFRIEISELGSLILANLPKTAHSKSDKQQIELRTRLQAEKETTFEKAKKLEKDRDALDVVSMTYFDLAKYFASALVIFQIALMMIPIVLIGRRAKFLDYTVGLSLSGIAVLGLSFLKYFSVLAVTQHLL
jgi:hypothetical protein